MASHREGLAETGTTTPTGLAEVGTTTPTGLAEVGTTTPTELAEVGTTTPTKLDILNEQACVIVQKMDEHSFSSDPESSIDNINELLKKFASSVSVELCNFRRVLKGLLQILTCEFPFQEISGSTETLKTTSFAAMLVELSKEHYHSNGDHTCDFHPESLIVHLLLTMIHAFRYDPQNKNIVNICFCALMHDIGKVSCADKCRLPDGKLVTMFPFHGELGGMVAKRAYGDAIYKVMQYDMFVAMCRAIECHMCGYHETTSNIKWDMLRCESNEVKEFLVPLSCADSMAALGNQKDKIDKVIKSRDAFKNHINQPFDLSCIMKAESYSGFLVQIKGTSGSGKSTLAKMLKGLYGDNCTVIDRDDIMTRIVATHKGEPYEGKVTGDKYAEYREYYAKNNLRTSVNATMMSQLTAGLANNKIVIVDTVMNLYSDFKHDYPHGINPFIISIHTIRNKLFTTTNCNDRIGVDEKKQIELSGDRGLFSCLPPSLLTGKKSVSKQHTSRYSNKNTRTGDKCVQPSIVLSVSMQENNQLVGIEYVMRFLNIVKDYVETNNQTSEPKVDTSNMSATEYLNHRLNHLNQELKDLQSSWKKITGDLQSLNFNVTVPYETRESNCVDTMEEDSVFLIKYRDGICNYWRERWAREMRGLCVRYNNGEFHLQKMCLQRGAEVLTKMVKKNQNTTQDIKSADISDFDANQQRVIQCFANGGNIDGTVSFKVDGSLFAATLYKKGSDDAIFWEQYVEKYGDEFHRTVINMCNELNLPYIAILSSQGTVLLGGPMQDYTVTSLFNVTSADAAKTPAMIFAEQGKHFFAKVTQLYQHLSHEGESFTLCFETVCPERTTYLGQRHTELAVEYSTSLLQFLGVTNLSNGKYTPHYQIEEIVYNAGFEQPNFWHITHTKQVDVLMAGLDEIINGTMTVGQFYEKHRPHNKFFTANSLEYIDIEGFIFFLNLPEGWVDYSKIKTLAYYKCHKYHHDNLSQLIELSKNESACKVFPMLRVIRDMFIGIEQKMKVLGANLLAALTENMNVLKSCLETNAQSSFDTKCRDTQIKMLVNIKGEGPINVILPAFEEIFPTLRGKTFDDAKTKDKFHIIIRNITMKLAQEKDATVNDNIETLIQNLNKGVMRENYLSGLFDFLLA